MADLEKTIAHLGTIRQPGNLVPQWRLEEKRLQRQHRTELVNNTVVIASGQSEQRDVEHAEA